jgi:hypothetical protein
MNIKRIRRLVFLIAMSSVVSQALYANVDIVFETEKPGVKTGDDVRANLHLVLGKDYFQIDENGLEYIYDFSGQKVFVLDSKKKVFEVYSLYAYAGFRLAEMENRLLIYDNFKNNSQYDKFLYYLNPVFLEHDFSMISGRDSQKIVSSTNSGKTIYKADGVTLMETDGKGKAISKNESVIFNKFMIYRVGGHPEILKKISDESVIPDSITMHSFDAGHEKTMYKMVGLKNIPESSYSLEGYKPGVVQFTGEFIGYIKNSTQNAEKNARQKVTLIESEIKKAVDEKIYLEAILGCMEIGLYNSRFDTPVCKTNVEKFQTDEKVKILLGNIHTDEKSKIETSYQKLKELESPSLKKTYVLWVFRANLKVRMGESQEAFDLYYKALKVNPYLSGVYKDIGELFYNNYNMDMAWFCWDIGRKIFSDHSMLKEIDKLEENLAKKYPEFF